MRVHIRIYHCELPPLHALPNINQDNSTESTRIFCRLNCCRWQVVILTNCSMCLLIFIPLTHPSQLFSLPHPFIERSWILYIYIMLTELRSMCGRWVCTNLAESLVQVCPKIAYIFFPKMANFLFEWGGGCGPLIPRLSHLCTSINHVTILLYHKWNIFL